MNTLRTSFSPMARSLGLTTTKGIFRSQINTAKPSLVVAPLSQSLFTKTAPALSQSSSSAPSDGSKPAATGTTTVSKAKSIMNSLLHGAGEADEIGQIAVETHSKLLARGKYVHEMQSKLCQHHGLLNMMKPAD
jgi:hypothetical protein